MKILVRAGYEGINTENVLDIFISYGEFESQAVAAAVMQDSWRKSYEQLCNLISRDLELESDIVVTGKGKTEYKDEHHTQYWYFRVLKEGSDTEFCTPLITMTARISGHVYTIKKDETWYNAADLARVSDEEIPYNCRWFQIGPRQRKFSLDKDSGTRKEVSHFVSSRVKYARSIDK